MATIGTLKRDQDGTFTGTIATLTLSAKISVRPFQADNDKGPSHRIYAGKVEIGAAWSKVSRDGRPYLSAKLDDISFVAPVYASIVEDADAPGLHSLIWSRRQAD